jgi:hypothetical protein
MLQCLLGRLENQVSPGLITVEIGESVGVQSY